MNGTPVLVVISGLPGVGKTTVARPLAAALGAVYLRIDSIEAALGRSVLKIRPAEDAGYLAAQAVARDNLRAGLTVVAECVNPTPRTQLAWRRAAEAEAARFLDVVLECGDAAEHRRRVETRRADLAGHVLPDWAAVQARDYSAPAGAFRLDTAAIPPEDTAAAIAERLRLLIASGE